MMRAWPLPALLAWALAWALCLGLLRAGSPPALALGLASAAGAALALAADTRWRRLFMAAGFPLSALLGGALNAPAWAWLLPLGLLALLYPLRSWRDAPLFPTPEQALTGLAARAPLAPGARVLDAGCGLGAGLRALHAEYPQARIEGLEWSAPLALVCALRCRFARVRRGDIWQADWSGYDLVYLFQRPESMPRALAKAAAELRPGAWLVSLEFEAREASPLARIEPVPGKPVWVYRAPWSAPSRPTR